MINITLNWNKLIKKSKFPFVNENVLNFAVFIHSMNFLVVQLQKLVMNLATYDYNRRCDTQKVSYALLGIGSIGYKKFHF